MFENRLIEPEGQGGCTAALRLVFFALVLVALCGPGRWALGQPPAGGAGQGAAAEALQPGPSDAAAPGQVPADRLLQAEQLADEALVQSAPEAEGSSLPPAGSGVGVSPIGPTKQINLLELLVRGGGLMIPIGAMSLLVVAIGAERLLALRRRRVLPPQLIRRLGELAGNEGGFDPRKAYRTCQQYPSAAANVIRAMLLKAGRPQTEVEHAVADASQREAARLYANVRWLSLAAGITPLLGLLGTVWGMIKAFFVTANLPLEANKAEYLADGIYVALVTTFAGLAVAIPAAVLAHLFETRIQKLFRELDEILLGLLPQLERFEGRLRLNAQQLAASSPVPPPPPVAGGSAQPARAAGSPK